MVFVLEVGTRKKIQTSLGRLKPQEPLLTNAQSVMFTAWRKSTKQNNNNNKKTKGTDVFLLSLLKLLLVSPSSSMCGIKVTLYICSFHTIFFDC